MLKHILQSTILAILLRPKIRDRDGHDKSRIVFDLTR